jgi:tetratricopeptide (TPR) repeat protein
MIRPLLPYSNALKLEPQNAVVYFELGKNYLASKDYPNAFSSFQKARNRPTNKWFFHRDVR